MKITKRQLRRIIKEEKAKVLVEMSPLRDANMALGSFADMTTTDQITSSILNVLQEVEMGAVEDGIDDEMAEEMARSAALLAVSQAFESAGLMDVMMALQKMIR